MNNIKFKEANAGNFRRGRTSEIEYIVMHYTGNFGDTAKNNADYFARAAIETSAHYFVDGKEIWQSVKDEDTAWHCGGRAYKHPYCRNSNSIGIEMCDSLTAVPDKVRDNAVELVRYLANKYGIDREHVIRHYDVTGKICPGPWVNHPEDFEAFLDLVFEEVEEVRYNTVKECPSWARETVQKLVDKEYLNGTGEGLDLSADMVRLLVILDRAGAFN